VQAAAGFLAGMDGVPDLALPPFSFPARYAQSLQLTRAGARCFPTTSAGRLFDTVAALTGFTRPITFEGQAAMWLEHLARPHHRDPDAYPFPFTDGVLDFRPLLYAVIDARLSGEDPGLIARRFHRGLAQGLHDAVAALAPARGLRTIVLSGGVFQNSLLLGDLAGLLSAAGYAIWTNQTVPANDGGISLGQAALAAFNRFDKPYA
jgi:hydrogenase maturation protein HypF